MTQADLLAMLQDRMTRLHQLDLDREREAAVLEVERIAIISEALERTLRGVHPLTAYLIAHEES